MADSRGTSFACRDDPPADRSDRRTTSRRGGVGGGEGPRRPSAGPKRRDAAAIPSRAHRRPTRTSAARPAPRPAPPAGHGPLGAGPASAAAPTTPRSARPPRPGDGPWAPPLAPPHCHPCHGGRRPPLGLPAPNGTPSSATAPAVVALHAAISMRPSEQGPGLHHLPEAGARVRSSVWRPDGRQRRPLGRGGGGDGVGPVRPRRQGWDPPTAPARAEPRAHGRRRRSSPKVLAPQHPLVGDEAATARPEAVPARPRCGSRPPPRSAARGRTPGPFDQHRRRPWPGASSARRYSASDAAGHSWRPVSVRPAGGPERHQPVPVPASAGRPAHRSSRSPGSTSRSRASRSTAHTSGHG